uniref:Uncharacterized protein n=1 Tax=Hyaloperonospora arabidopsidis (strain Emoy2) TaxID=559515 RepID=M4B8Q1_HYAAE
MPPLQQLPNAVSSATHETLLTAAEAATASDQAAAEAAEAAADAAVAAAHSEVLPSYSPASAESLGLASSFGSSDAFGLLPGTTLPSAAAAGLNLDDVPKRKRGRPPKKDVAARAKGDVEKALKQQQQQQMPLWGYGLPMPLLPGFPPGMLSGMSNPGAVVMKGDHATCEDELEQEGDAERPSKTAKKKQRGTGKPRGRPRTRPRPGEIIRRVKPLPIAPANFSVMYNYSLSNLAHKSAELNGDGSVADTDATTGTDEAQDRGLASLSASLLSGEHE